MIRPILTFVGSTACLLLVLKLTLLLAAAWLATRLLHRRSAASRHLVWLAALTGALALGVLAPVAPRLAVRVPEAAVRAVPRLVIPDAPPTSRPDRATRVIGAETKPAVVRSAPPIRRAIAWPIGWMVAALWCAGFVVVLLWSALGHVGLWGLFRSAIPVERAAWNRHYGVAPPESGVQVRLALSSAVGTPLTWGWRHPIVLLPSRSSGWSLERRRAALRHELAHVSRGDYLAQLVAMLACAVYWFHPLVWWSAARLRSESEHACDDLVLASGTPAPAYADDLLAVAHGARDARGSSLVAIGMARRSNLEGRLLAVLDDARVRGALGARARIVTLVITLLVLVPFAGLELRQGVARAETTAVAWGEGSSAAPAVAAAPAVEPKVPAMPSMMKEADGTDGDHSMSNTMPASPGGTLLLDLETGGLVTIHAWDRNQVSVHVELGGSDWQHTSVEIGPERGGITVRATHTGNRTTYSTGHRFEIQVPARYDVRLRSAGGGVTIVGVEGRFEGTTGGGDLMLENARGRAALTTGGGDIEVSDSELEGSVMTGGGTVKFSRVKGGLRGSSGSGPVIYSDAEGAGGNENVVGDVTNLVVGDDHEKIRVGSKQVGYLHVSKAGGTVDLDDVPNGAEITTGGGEIHVRRGSGTVDASTGGGDIEIGPIAGSVSATTGAGSVSIQLASIGGREQSVFVRSGTGDVIVDVPGDLNARIDLETAYTESYGRPAQITSAWTLQRDPVTDWDDAHGTPRRFVRAHGVAGNGEGKITIRTVNGNVELRRAGARTNVK